MASRITSIDRDLQLATAGLSPQAISAALAQYARSELSQAIGSGEASSTYDRYVNGRLGADESTVVAPGPILYVFSWWQEVVQFALQAAIDRSPVDSGDYKRAWQVMVGQQIVADPKDIPINADVMIVNPLPYARKIDVGHMKMSVPPFVVEDVRQQVMRIFGNVVSAKRVMTLLPGGYILKGHFSRGVRQFARTKLRADTRAGSEMTYPALRLSMKAG